MKEGWGIKRLGEVCGFVRGPFGGSLKKSVFVENGFAVYEQQHAIYNQFDEIRYFIDDAKFQAMRRFELRPNDLIMSCSGTMGKVAVVPDNIRQGIINQALLKLTPLGAISPEFLKYWMDSTDFQEKLQEQSGGAAIQNVASVSILKEIQIPLPPLTEQQRIVRILDEAFEGIATATANAEKNLENARALFESELEAVFRERGEGWEEKTLDQVCIVERGSSPRPIKEYFTTAPDGVNWIKIGDTEEGGKYVYSTAQKITPEGANQSRFVKEGDFILTNSMSYGRPYIMKTSGYIHDGWFVLRLNISIDTDYFYYLLSSPVVQSQFARLASGAVVKNISGDLVKKAVLPIAPLNRQHGIVEKLSMLAEETQRLESIYERKLAALEELKKAMLGEAFEGGL